jgi:hypothetical protein
MTRRQMIASPFVGLAALAAGRLAKLIPPSAPARTLGHSRVIGRSYGFNLVAMRNERAMLEMIAKAAERYVRVARTTP